MTSKAEANRINATIFIIAFLHILSAIFCFNTEPATISDHGGYYLVFYYPLFTCFTELTFAIFFILWARRVKACSHTKTATWLYLALPILSLFDTLFDPNWALYYSISSSALLLAIVINFIIFLVRAYGNR